MRSFCLPARIFFVRRRRFGFVLLFFSPFLSKQTRTAGIDVKNSKNYLLLLLLLLILSIHNMQKWFEYEMSTNVSTSTSLPHQKNSFEISFIIIQFDCFMRYAAQSRFCADVVFC